MLPEKLLFYFLAFLSLGICFWQIRSRIALWLSGKPLGPIREGIKYWLPTREGLGRWANNVGLYVIGQKKVRSSRPRSGAPMHLMLFYGFLTLFIGTTLLAINTYSPFKFHKGLYYLIYEMALDVMGLGFLIACVWAFFRRLAMTRAELGWADYHGDQDEKQWREGRRRPMSGTMNDYAVLGLLFITGFTGYLAEAARMALNPQPFDWSAPVGHALSLALPQLSVEQYKFVWWFHMAWVFAFFMLIPRFRLRHIVMAILVSAGYEKKPWGELKPITMEEVETTGQIGVTLAKDYSRWQLMSMDACMECGRCTEVCPAWNVGKVLNPKLVVQDIRGSMASGVAVAEAVSEEALWACTTCNACVEACPVLIPHVDLIVGARRSLVAEGKLSGTGATMLRQVGSTGSAWGQAAIDREDWMKGLDVPLCRDGVEFEYLMWVGCAGATDPGAIRTTKAVAQLLKRAGVKFACLGKEEACTGDPARRIGEEFLFQEKAMQNVSVFQKYKVKKIVTACPHCMNTFKNEYHQFDGDVEVVHHTQLLSQLVDDGKLAASNPNKGEVTYHDPCYLARVNNESDAPRSLVGDATNLNSEAIDLVQWLQNGPSSGGALAEPEHRGRKTLCCGAGGGRMWMEEEPNQRPGNRRAEELLATGAKTVAVGCPFCRIMLDASIKQVSEEEIRLVDLAEMLQEANAE
ncbi:MAG: (Fe-S)-binding protein [Armatimonadetes bacterium]|nr:(Fe-S)-binding protein [Armatimonadota bacterium]